MAQQAPRHPRLRRSTAAAAVGLLPLLLILPSASAPAPSAGCGNCTGLQDINFGDGKIAHNKIGSAAACCASCQQNAACKVWAYTKATGDCWLKDNKRPLPSPHEPGIFTGTCGGAGCYFLVFGGLIEKYGTNRESVTLQAPSQRHRRHPRQSRRRRVIA
eukprot:SAG31_NODE_13777_length_847_cov_1.477273_1_plen_159_part_10